MKTGMVGAMLFVALAMPAICRADEIIIPFPINQRQMVKELKKQGLDFSDSTKAVGFVKNEGTQTTVYTYRAMNIYELDKIKNAAFKSVRK